MRRYQSLLSKLYIFLDALATILALLSAWVIRFKSPFLPQYHAISFASYMSVLPEAVLAILFFAGFLGLYGTTRASRMKVIAIQQFKSVVAMALVIVTVLYFNKELNYSRGVLFLAIILTWLFSLIGRFIVRFILKEARRKGFNRKFVLLVGMTNTTIRFLDQLRRHDDMGYHVIGYVSTGNANTEVAATLSNLSVPCLGTIEKLDTILSEQIVDHLIFTLPSDESRLIRSLMEIAESHGVHALLVPNFIDILPSRPRFDEFAGIPIVDTRYTPLDDALNIALKRTFDIIFSILVLILFSPLYLIIGLLVRLSSPGPIIYRQARLGRNKRQFTMYKFRTMYEDNKIGNHRWTVPNDLRRTLIGRFLRATSLDELPQFFNVLRGDMSVIGPRPEQPYFVQQFREDIPRYMIKHRVRPGITGWAQVNGLRGDTSISDRIEYDLRYIEDWSFTWDMRIVFLTIWKGFRNRNAY